MDGITDCDEGTDGIEVTSIPLGKNFPAGLLVVQDGSNTDQEIQAPQNFKLVSGNSIVVQFNPPLEVR